MSELVAAQGAAGPAVAERRAGAEPRGGPGAAGSADAEERLERHRVELTGYCYRMLGSAFDAEDAVQEVMVRAWRSLDRFEGRAALRTWLYRIATNVCLDMLKGSGRRARPMDLSSPQPATAALPDALPESAWVEPAPDGRVLDGAGDPAEVAVARDSVRLAFVAALQHLPPRQRAVLILREVLAWKASEVAELLGTSVPSVNSALQRARATLRAAAGEDSEPARPLDAGQRALLERYVDAFQRYDLEALTSLLHEDARLTMPPYPLWLRGAAEIRAWMLGTGIGCRGSRLLPVTANGSPAFAQYRPAPDGEGYEAWALQIIEISAGRISGINSFLDTAHFFPLFGLPARLGPDGLPLPGALPGETHGQDAVQAEQPQEPQQFRPHVPQR
ncbi:sigma-70 family RNA polymerase sigma factor [Streptomyces zingiberis]|uniref:Sigma-70 family RNA polymerase sigma factor n=1 Tax=Streptomyces zingiberis TaxID=2053010 RepID=A0ABX1BPJ0_9ACTN|nr:sigma-70 family RNA polymerase sigma factor [Streptomyces zingiberis]NJP99645.1 sigma-70 family RNA polymerase sigma factor [Streptomyces zingiberis]